jgi:hypothetical protein
VLIDTLLKHYQSQNDPRVRNREIAAETLFKTFVEDIKAYLAFNVRPRDMGDISLIFAFIRGFSYFYGFYLVFGILFN